MKYKSLHLRKKRLKWFSEETFSKLCFSLRRSRRSKGENKNKPLINDHYVIQSYQRRLKPEKTETKFEEESRSCKNKQKNRRKRSANIQAAHKNHKQRLTCCIVGTSYRLFRRRFPCPKSNRRNRNSWKRKRILISASFFCQSFFFTEMANSSYVFHRA